MAVNGYTRQAAGNIAAGLAINAEDFNAEYDQLVIAFGNAAGHDHSGSVTGSGQKIPLATAVTGTLPIANGGSGITSGTSGGILGFTGATTLASSVLLTASAIVLGGGAGATPTPMGSLGTTTTVLHGNAAGAPTFGAVILTADVTGTLPVANGGTGITSLGTGVATFLGTPSSANLASALTDESGTGLVTFSTGPTAWTPADASGASLSTTNNGSFYYKVGKQVILCLDVTYPSTANGSTALLSGLPFTATGTLANNVFNFPVTFSAGATHVITITAGGTNLEFINSSSGSAFTNANLTANRCKATLIYFTD